MTSKRAPRGLTARPPKHISIATPSHAELCPSRADPLDNAALTAAQLQINPLETTARTPRDRITAIPHRARACSYKPFSIHDAAQLRQNGFGPRQKMAHLNAAVKTTDPPHGPT
jgi:hypothetical protein